MNNIPSTKQAVPVERANRLQFGISLALTIGFVLPAARIVETNLQSRLGSWGAFGASLVAAGLLGALISTVVMLWFKRRGR